MSDNKVIDKLNKKYGANAVITLGSDELPVTHVVPTGICSLDSILGIGGLPRGRLVEIYGPPQGGKSTLCYGVLAEAQKLGLRCAYVDAEHALDKAYMNAIGVTDDLLINQPGSGEEGLTVLHNLVKEKAADVIVVDSVAALVPQQIIESDIGDCNVASLARLMSGAIKKLTGLASINNVLVVFINQITYKIGGYGNPETTPGGNALKYHASIRLDVRGKQKILKGGNPIGVTTRVKVVKNKLAVPYKNCEFDLILGVGIDRYKDIATTAKLEGIITLKGSWVYYKESQLCQGVDSFIALLREDPELYESVLRTVLEGKKND
jgi:recombination protein RecA